jgi:hypothetical protein
MKRISSHKRISERVKPQLGNTFALARYSYRVRSVGRRSYALRQAARVAVSASAHCSRSCGADSTDSAAAHATARACHQDIPARRASAKPSRKIVRGSPWAPSITNNSSGPGSGSGLGGGGGGSSPTALKPLASRQLRAITARGVLVDGCESESAKGEPFVPTPVHDCPARVHSRADGVRRRTGSPARTRSPSSQSPSAHDCTCGRTRQAAPMFATLEVRLVRPQLCHPHHRPA